MGKDPSQDYILNEIRSLEESIKDASNKVNGLDKTIAEYKVSFDHHVAIDEHMYAELKRMNDILAQNTESLRTHIKRTDLLEQAVMKMDVKLTSLEIKDIEKEAVKKWIKDTAKLTAKICAAGAALVTAAMAAPTFIKWLISLAG